MKINLQGIIPTKEAYAFLSTYSSAVETYSDIGHSLPVDVRHR